MSNQPVKIIPDLAEALERVREFGSCNMFHIECVMMHLEDNGDEGAAVWVEENPVTYGRLIFNGYTVVDTPDQMDSDYS